MSCFAISVMKLGTCYDSVIHPGDSDRSTSVFPAPRKAAGEGRWARSWSVHALVHLAFAGESLVSAALTLAVPGLLVYEAEILTQDAEGQMR